MATPLMLKVPIIKHCGGRCVLCVGMCNMWFIAIKIIMLILTPLLLTLGSTKGISSPIGTRGHATSYYMR